MSLRQPDVVTVAVTRADGGVTVLRIIENSYRLNDKGERFLWRHVDVTADYVDYQISRYVKDGHWVGPLAPVGWRFVPNDYLDDTSDLTFRDAWIDAPLGGPGWGKPGTDMVKAREIHRTRLRQMRAPLLEALDTDYMRADEAGDQQEKKRIALRKQALRDVTADPAIEAAVSPEALKAVIPGALRG